MSQPIGRVQGGKTGKSFVVRWDSQTGKVYVEVGWGGAQIAGKASSASDAMRRAEAHVYNK